jgi:hypothetical protein
MKLSVTCKSGHKGEETPCAFHLGGRRLPVLMTLACWLDMPYKYFEVGVEDGRRFVLRQDVVLRTWELAGVFAASRPRPAPRPAATRWWRFRRIPWLTARSRES